jgi:signal transduction histidine kinase
VGDAVAMIAVEPAPGLAVATPHEVALRALAPLLDNALRHARSRVTLRARRAGTQVAISVEDDGPGVPDGDRDLVFEPGHHSPDSPGAGLGLPLARRVARAAGGDVHLDPDRSSRFVLTLPAVP